MKSGRRAWGVLGVVAFIGGVLLFAYSHDRCVESGREPGGARDAFIVRHNATTTVVIHDLIPVGRKGWRYRLVAIDGATGARLATKPFETGRCFGIQAGRVRCKLEGKVVTLDVRTLEVAEPTDSPWTNPRLGFGESNVTCYRTRTVWIDDASWGFAGRASKVFMKLPIPAEGTPQQRTPLFGASLLTVDLEGGWLHRIANDFLVQHRTSSEESAGYLLSRIGFDGIARWTFPLVDECSAVGVDPDRVIVTTLRTSRAIAIDARTGWMLWQVQLSD